MKVLARFLLGLTDHDLDNAIYAIKEYQRVRVTTASMDESLGRVIGVLIWLTS